MGSVWYGLNVYVNLQHLQEIQSQLTNLSESAGFPPDTPAIIYQDVVAPGSAILPEDYYSIGENQHNGSQNHQ